LKAINFRFVTFRLCDCRELYNHNYNYGPRKLILNANYNLCVKIYCVYLNMSQHLPFHLADKSRYPVSPEEEEEEEAGGGKHS